MNAYKAIKHSLLILCTTSTIYMEILSNVVRRIVMYENIYHALEYKLLNHVFSYDKKVQKC